MHVDTIVKLVEAGFTADEIRAWLATPRAQAQAQAQAPAQATKRPGRPPRPAARPTTAVMQAGETETPQPVKNGSVKALVVRRYASTQGAEPMPAEAVEWAKRALVQAPGKSLVYQEVKDRFVADCPDLRPTLCFSAIKLAHPGVSHKRAEGLGPYVLDGMGWAQ